MRRETGQKQLILMNALKRMKRISIYAEVGFKTQMKDVLANYSWEGKECFKAMDLALKQYKLPSSELLWSAGSAPQDVEEVFKVAALNFVLEPAQNSFLERIQLVALGEQFCEDHIQGESTAPLGNLPIERIGQLAWGAFSLKKIRQHQSETIVNSHRPYRIRNRNRNGDQLSLQDLTMIECAASYQGLHFDCSFMRQLSTAGANTVHRIAMILANDFHARIDVAIVKAAKLLSDPIVHGDADHCYCMLKERRFPASWALQYRLD